MQYWNHQLEQVKLYVFFVQYCLGCLLIMQTLNLYRKYISYTYHVHIHNWNKFKNNYRRLVLDLRYVILDRERNSASGRNLKVLKGVIWLKLAQRRWKLRLSWWRDVRGWRESKNNNWKNLRVIIIGVKWIVWDFWRVVIKIW
jgi:hypothetical protein